MWNQLQEKYIRFRLHLNPSHLYAYVIIRWRYWMIFSRVGAPLFVSGFIFVHSFVKNALVNILMVLSNVWKNENLQREAQVVNLHEGASSVLQIFCAFLTDAYIGRFRMVICSSVFYVIGLSLFWVAGWHLPSLQIQIFYLALALLVLGRAAEEISLQDFLNDQLLMPLPVITENDKKREYQRNNIYGRISNISGAVVAFLVLPFIINSWKLVSMVSTVGFVVGFMWFLIGTILYKCKKLTGSPLSDVLFVIKMAILKRNLDFPSDHVQILPKVSWVRWLDKAGIQQGTVCTAQKVKEVKFLLRMVPLWITFPAYSMVYATGSTFFLEQATSMDEHAPVVLFANLPTLISFITAHLSGLLYKKLSQKMKRQQLMHARVGLGMIFSFLCSITAWRIADCKHHLARGEVFILTPQFFMLGIMQGLSEEGFLSFFDSQDCESFRDYGRAFIEFMMGIGKFLSALFISAFASWFKANIKSSQLNKYYKMLAIVSFLNVILYLLVFFVTVWYEDDQFPPEEGKLLQDIENGIGWTLSHEIHGPMVSHSLSGQTHRNPTTQHSSTARSGPSTSWEGEFGSRTSLREDSVSLLNVSTGKGTTEYDNVGANHQPTTSINLTRYFTSPVPSKSSSGIRWRSLSMK